MSEEPAGATTTPQAANEQQGDCQARDLCELWCRYGWLGVWELHVLYVGQPP